MKTWNNFFDLLSPHVPGCPQAAQTIALRQAAIAFCEQSLAWRYAHPEILVLSDTAKYFFDPPEGATVHAVTYAEFNDKQIEVSTMEHEIKIWNWRNVSGIPEYVLGGPISFTLVPKPDLSGTLKVRVVLKPSQGSAGIDDDIFNEYHEAIEHGALARLMLSPKKPYTDAVLANYHAQMFLIQTARAGVREAKSYNRSPLRTSIMRRR